MVCVLALLVTFLTLPAPPRWPMVAVVLTKSAAPGLLVLTLTTLPVLVLAVASLPPLLVRLLWVLRLVCVLTTSTVPALTLLCSTPPRRRLVTVSRVTTPAVLVAIHLETLERVVTLPALLAITPIILEMVTLLALVLSATAAATPLPVTPKLALALLVGTPVLALPVQELATVTTSITALVTIRPKSCVAATLAVASVIRITPGSEVVVWQHTKKPKLADIIGLKIWVLPPGETLPVNVRQERVCQRMINFSI